MCFILFSCFHDCGEHGFCDVDYKCKCDLGWLGENCSTDCGCNGHSDCSQGIGVCDKCQGTVPWSPNIHIQILLTNLHTVISLTEFNKRSNHFQLGDHFVNSPNLFFWLFTDIIRRELMLITKVYWVNLGFWETAHLPYPPPPPKTTFCPKWQVLMLA